MGDFYNKGIYKHSDYYYAVQQALIKHFNYILNDECLNLLDNVELYTK